MNKLFKLILAHRLENQRHVSCEFLEYEDVIDLDSFLQVPGPYLIIFFTLYALASIITYYLFNLHSNARDLVEDYISNSYIAWLSGYCFNFILGLLLTTLVFFIFFYLDFIITDRIYTFMPTD